MLVIGSNLLIRTPNLSVYSDESGRWARSFCGNLPVTGLQVEHVAPSIVFLLSSSYIVMTLGKNTGHSVCTAVLCSVVPAFRQVFRTESHLERWDSLVVSRLPTGYGSSSRRTR